MRDSINRLWLQKVVSFWIKAFAKFEAYAWDTIAKTRMTQVLVLSALKSLAERMHWWSTVISFRSTYNIDDKGILRHA